MDTQIKDFLSTHQICSLTTQLPDGSPHAAALHYSHSDNPFAVYFSTEKSSKKCEGLLNGETVKASVVVGFSEKEWITMQMDGKITTVTDKTELEKIHKIHYAKHPHAEQFKDAPETIFLSFTPTWWRYTDYNTKPETVISFGK